MFYPEFDPPTIVAGIGQYKVTHMFLAPEMIKALLVVPGVGQADLSSLKIISYGASPIGDKVLVDGMRTFGCGFKPVYGLTETTGAVAFLDPEDHDPDGPRARLLRSAGKAGDVVKLRIVDGENIYPAEVENLLMKPPAVADGAVIGVPDDKWGEAVKACVVLKPGASATIVAFQPRIPAPGKSDGSWRLGRCPRQERGSEHRFAVGRDSRRARR